MDGVATPIIGRPRPLPGHDTPNPAYHPHTLNYEEPVITRRPNALASQKPQDFNVLTSKVEVATGELRAKFRGTDTHSRQMSMQFPQHSAPGGIALLSPALHYLAGHCTSYYPVQYSPI